MIKISTSYQLEPGERGRWFIKEKELNSHPITIGDGSKYDIDIRGLTSALEIGLTEFGSIYARSLSENGLKLNPLNGNSSQYLEYVRADGKLKNIVITPEDEVRLERRVLSESQEVLVKILR